MTTSGDRSTALRCTGLVKRYGELTAVHALDLEVHRGECFGLLGPNGAGKTTTVEMLEGLLAPDAGSIELLGMRWGDDDRALRERLGIQLQETQLGERLSVEETVRLFRSFYRTGLSVTETLSALDLSHKRTARVGRLSGGQRQRLSVACALVGRPDLLFLDEPTTGLDPRSRRQLWDLLRRFCAGGGTVLLTTHNMEEASALCDRIAIVDHGRMVAHGSPRELIATLGASHIIEFAVASNGPGPSSTRLAALPGVHDVQMGAGTCTLNTDAPQRALPALMQLLSEGEWELTQLITHGATLEDVFVARTGRHLRDE